ncbi:replication protein A 70 kDa DNA-binding subunit B-like [Rutidosis leptorrhynchoides]|uniref:replication protein A 70 kDa DNA-binding subunit B-like n=1 Tax=Rutidosis leptorrhynchoides TaxID=125765 RepID=UPI003A9981F8
MALATQNDTVQANERTYSYLHELQVGKEAEGNVIQLTARSTVAHCFISRLKEGSVYLLNKFEVIPNKDDYRLLRNNKVLIQLQGSTFLKKISGDEHSGFIRHPYACIPFEDLEPNGGKYQIDVVGCVLNFGSVTPQKGGSTTLEFQLVNERHRRVRVTLWGKLGDSFLARKPTVTSQDSIILSSVSVRKDYYGETFLSSTSATLIIDDAQVPTLANFINKISAMEFADDMGELAPQRQLPPPKEGSIVDLLTMARRGKNNVADVFKCTVELTNVRMKNSWFYNSCGICKAKKSISRQDGGFWCESCEKRFPSRLQGCYYPFLPFDVRDSTAETVVVMFDETAEQLTGTTAQSLLDAQDAVTCTTVLPNPLANLLNTTQVLLLKVNSYYEHGTYESFNCIKVYSDEDDSAPAVSDNLDPGVFPPAVKPGAASTVPPVATPKGVKRTIEIPTPIKELELPSHRKFIVTTSDSEEDTGAVTVT